jgi:hypothetical protein
MLKRLENNRYITSETYKIFMNYSNHNEWEANKIEPRCGVREIKYHGDINNLKTL